ncbi:MAG: hypothetical protein ABIN80_03960 [Dyadobacter sp.]|uniref:hypothetical protein n=1 Tax=Dyadobacter sp. TaxID=1914288 RepID=UPI003264F979
MKNLSYYFILLVFSILNLGCKDSKDEALLGMYFSNSVYISIKDPKGTDLLDPSNPESLTRFRVYYLINGKRKLIYDPWMDAPYGYVIEKFAVNDHYHLQVFANFPNIDNDKSLECITYLEFEDGSTDTIAASYVIRKAYTAINKASYNGQLEWDEAKPNADLSTFKVIKP